MQLGFLQTHTEVASETKSTTIFPVPIDMLTPFLKNVIRRKLISGKGRF